MNLEGVEKREEVEEVKGARHNFSEPKPQSLENATSGKLDLFFFFQKKTCFLLFLYHSATSEKQKTASKICWEGPFP